MPILLEKKKSNSFGQRSNPRLWIAEAYHLTLTQSNERGEPGQPWATADSQRSSFLATELMQLRSWEQRCIELLTLLASRNSLDKEERS